jgi:hypothetical protein
MPRPGFEPGSPARKAGILGHYTIGALNLIYKRLSEILKNKKLKEFNESKNMAFKNLVFVMITM